MVTWIETYLKDINFDIIETNPDGNCFFECLQIAIESSGIDFELKSIKDFRRYLHSIVSEDYYNQLIALYAAMKADINSNNDNAHPDALSEFIFIERYGLDTFSKIKKFILNDSFWANNWAINELEKKLELKAIILSEENFDQGNLENILQCTNTDKKVVPKCKICGITHNQLTNPDVSKTDFINKHSKIGIVDHEFIDIEEESIVKPRGYFIVTYSGNHYELISYKDENSIINVFYNKPNELPKKVKDLVKRICPNMIKFPKFIRKKTKLSKKQSPKKTSPVKPNSGQTSVKKPSPVKTSPIKLSPTKTKTRKIKRKLVTKNIIVTDTLPMKWSKEYKGKYLRGHVTKPVKKYKSLKNAKDNSTNKKTVGGITISKKGIYTLRKGKELLNSPNDESSWIKL